MIDFFKDDRIIVGKGFFKLKKNFLGKRYHFVSSDTITVDEI